MKYITITGKNIKVTNAILRMSYTPLCCDVKNKYNNNDSSVEKSKCKNHAHVYCFETFVNSLI